MLMTKAACLLLVLVKMEYIFHRKPDLKLANMQLQPISPSSLSGLSFVKNTSICSTRKF